MKTIQTARIWVFVNRAPVKLSLQPDRPLRWHKFTRDDEGYSSEGHEWRWDGNTLLDHHGCDGRDCDGRVSDARLFLTTPGSFRVTDAHPHHTTRGYWNDPAAIPAGVLWPAWKEITSRRRLRDFSAESANY